MLEQTFLHVPGFKAADERRLWTQGCRNWDDFIAQPGRFDCGGNDPATVLEVLKRSRAALSEGRATFFRYGLGVTEAWRAFPDFRHRCVYLDIETDGGNSPASITMVGLSDGDTFQCLIKGRDLNDFAKVIGDYAMIVTYCGAAFDIPILKKRFPDVKFDHLHMDLAPAFRRLGYRGGLKKIERQLGIVRPSGTEGLDGRDAIRLWRRYTVLDEQGSLDTLIAYNREDVVNMTRLAEVAYDKLQRLTGYETTWVPSEGLPGRQGSFPKSEGFAAS